MNVEFPLNTVHHFGSNFSLFLLLHGSKQKATHKRVQKKAFFFENQMKKIRRQKNLLATQYYTFQSSFSVHFLCVCARWVLMLLLFTLFTLHCKKSSLFFLLLNIVIPVKMNFLWYFSAFVSFYFVRTKVITEAGVFWIFPNFGQFWLLQRAKLPSSFTFVVAFGCL